MSPAFKILLFAPSTGNAMGPLVDVLAEELGKISTLTLVVPAHAPAFAHKQQVRFASHANKLMRVFTLSSPLFFWQMHKLLKAQKPSVVHVFNGEGYPATLWLALATRLHGIPLVTTVHDPESHPGSFWDALNRKLARVTLRLSKRVQIFNPKFEKAIRAQGLPKSSGVDSIPHGSIASHYTRHIKKGIKRENMVLLFGRLEKYKGIETLVAAANHLPANIKVCIAGSGPLPEATLTAIKSNPKRFEFHHRFIGDAEVATLMQRAGVLALPYTHVTQSGLPLIAAEFKVPLVASALGSFVEDAPLVGGVLVPPNQPEALAKAIQKAMGKPTKMPPRHRYNELAEDYLAMYKKAARKPSSK